MLTSRRGRCSTLCLGSWPDLFKEYGKLSHAVCFYFYNWDVIEPKSNDMKKKLLLLSLINLVFSYSISQNNINNPYWKIEKILEFPNKSKNQLFILAEKFVDYGWQSPKDHMVSIEEVTSDKKPEYDLNNAVQSKNKESGEIYIRVSSAFETRFHSPFVKSIWFEYNIKLTINNKGNVIIEIYNLKADEFISDEVKYSGLYRNQLRGLEMELENIPNSLKEFILKN